MRLCELSGMLESGSTRSYTNIKLDFYIQNTEKEKIIKKILYFICACTHVHMYIPYIYIYFFFRFHMGILQVFISHAFNKLSNSANCSCFHFISFSFCSFARFRRFSSFRGHVSSVLQGPPFPL